MKRSQQTELSGDLCFSCERFIGPADVCPYCGMDSVKSPVLKKLRYTALVLALIGVAYLYLMAAWTKPGITKIGDVTPTMNFARMTIQGHVKRTAYVGHQHGVTNYVSFVVQDGTGELQVRAYRDVARAVAAQGLPEQGEGVTVDGVLKVSAQGVLRLFLQKAELLHTEGLLDHD